MNTAGFVEIINEERQALRSAIERLKLLVKKDESLQSTIDRLLRLDERLEMLSRLNTSAKIKPDDLRVIIREIFGTETLERGKYELLLRWIKENI